MGIAASIGVATSSQDYRQIEDLLHDADRAMFVFGGYWFGNWDPVKKNFSWVVLAIIIISVMPMVVEYLRSRRGPRG